jgi:catechol 2,3-dioxygenase-like lactoylglutathione lyase family enzyme
VRLDHCGKPPPAPAKPARARSAPPRQRLSAVSDWERSNAFYRDVLGAEIIQRDEWFGFYVFDDWQLNFHGPGFERAQRPAAGPARQQRPLLRWGGPVEEAVEHLERLGVPIEAGPGSAEFRRGRITSVYFRDPDGSLLEFLSCD